MSARRTVSTASTWAAMLLLSSLAGCTPVVEPDNGEKGRDLNSGGVQCGPTTCASSDVCCNESCGICTPPGGFCTQGLCSAADAGTVDAGTGPKCGPSTCA